MRALLGIVLILTYTVAVTLSAVVPLAILWAVWHYVHTK